MNLFDGRPALSYSNLVIPFVNLPEFDTERMQLRLTITLQR